MFSKSLILVLISLLSFSCCEAFVTPAATVKLSYRQTKLNASGIEQSSPIDSFVEDLKMRFRIFQESNAAGSSFKQTVANVIAGEYNQAEVRAEVDELIDSASCGKFTTDVFTKINT